MTLLYSKNITYNELYKNVCKLANVLKDKNVSKGDRVILYMPMVPEAAYAMLACARIGAIHSGCFRWIFSRGTGKQNKRLWRNCYHYG